MDDYHHYNTWFALRGDSEPLKARCHAFLAAVPAKQTSYRADHRFHLALAKGDVRGMEAALLELVEPKLMRWRQSEERAYTQ